MNEIAPFPPHRQLWLRVLALSATLLAALPHGGAYAQVTNYQQNQQNQSPTSTSTYPLNLPQNSSYPTTQQYPSLPPSIPNDQTVTNTNPSNPDSLDGHLRTDFNGLTREDILRRDRSLRMGQEPPTEFQRLVNDSTGVRLPIFAASLFVDIPVTFAPVDDFPVTRDYIIGPGDELRIQVFGQVNQRGAFFVDRTGNISYPSVGTIHPAGIKYSQLQDFLKREFSRVFRNFDLTVTLGHLRSIQVFVVGAARQPGSYTISSMSTLLNALFSSGGPTAQGSLRDIQVLRKDTPTVHFDLYDLLLHGDKSKDVQLAPGDVIFIPPAGLQVALVGSVNSAAIYEIRPGTTASELIKLAGGETSVALGTQIRIERIFEHTMRNIVDVDLGQNPLAKKEDPILAGGDIITVHPILDRYKDAVTLRGNVAAPGRYVWHAGMRITDLVPNRDQLITREYYSRRNALGSALPEYSTIPYSNRGSSNNSYGNNGLGDYQNGASSNNGSSNASGNNSPGNGVANNNAANSSTGNGVPNGTNPGNNNANLNSQNVGPPVGSLQVRGSDPARSGDNSQSGPSSSSANGGGAVGTALIGSNSVFPAINDVLLSAPDLDWSYAVVERLDAKTLTTSLLPFHPGRLFLENDQTQNMELQTGDVVTFFSTADLKVPTSQQTRFVRLEGEFVASGVYSVEPGETFRHLLARAGGFTNEAYLYGSEFTRQSTRRFQQQRLNEYADNLDAQISISAASGNARAVSDRDAAATAASTLSARESVTRLRRVVPIGRIVLDLKPDSRGVESVPDLSLEDGDRFVVPRVPSTVSVEGQVYSANAFVYMRSRHERDYLRQAGGPDRGADRKRTFILRADGSVFSTQYGKVDRALIFPGDTIVVPPQLEHGSILRNLLDFSNVIGQFGIGAAAISLLTR